jgi:hypothetical protein
MGRQHSDPTSAIKATATIVAANGTLRHRNRARDLTDDDGIAGTTVYVCYSYTESSSLLVYSVWIELDGGETMQDAIYTRAPLYTTSAVRCMHLAHHLHDASFKLQYLANVCCCISQRDPEPVRSRSFGPPSTKKQNEAHVLLWLFSSSAHRELLFIFFLPLIHSQLRESVCERKWARLMVLQRIRDREEREINHGSRALHFLNKKWRKFKF